MFEPVDFMDVFKASTISGYDNQGHVCMKIKPENVEQAVALANVDYINLNVCRLYLIEAGRLAKLNNNPMLSDLEKIIAIDKNEDFEIAIKLNELVSKYNIKSIF